MNTGIDGGMNKVFASKLPDGNTGLSDGGDSQSLSLVALSRAPGTIPSTVNPPHGRVTSPAEPLAASMAPSATPAHVASASPNAKSMKSSAASPARWESAARCRYHRQRASSSGEAEGDRGQAERAAAPGSIDGKGIEARNQTVRRASTGETRALLRSGRGRTRCRPERRPGRRCTADRAGKFVREPLLGREVRAFRPQLGPFRFDRIETGP